MHARNLTPHEREALFIADLLDRQGDTLPADVIRGRVDSVGISDDADFRARLSFAGFNEEYIASALRRVHASIAAADAGGA